MSFNAPDLPPIPSPLQRVVNEDGTMNEHWYRFFSGLHAVARAISRFLKIEFP
jgi:hypothetical protein